MNINFYLVSTVFCSSLGLSACQITTTAPSKELPQHENIRTMQAAIDSDGDGVLDAIDECPETPPNVVVDAKGCPVEVDVGGLEMEFNGFFPPKSSQLPVVYNEDFITMAKSLNEYPRASVFIFGHAATNEINKGSLARNRALIVKNALVLQHGIDAKRMRTYDCSDNLFVEDTDNIDRNFKALKLKNIESKQSRVTLLASSGVSDLMDLEYVSYTKKYGEYAKRCEPFK